MIVIDNFEIQDSGSQLNIKLTTDATFIITKVLLWNFDTFKDYTKAIDLSYKLSGLSNTEDFLVTAAELEIDSFKDIWFIEVETNATSSPCDLLLNPALGITYDFAPYYRCLLDKFLKHHTDECSIENVSLSETILTISLLLQMLEDGIEYGYYNQVIELLAKIKRLCNLNACNNCKQVVCSSCSKFKQS